MRDWQSPRGANFRFARQPPTIVTWAELHFYDLLLIRPSGFVNSAAFIRTNQLSSSWAVLNIADHANHACQKFDGVPSLTESFPPASNRYPADPPASIGAIGHRGRLRG